MSSKQMASALAEPGNDLAILPDFIIIGAMKAGTTTLYDLLATHPDIGMSREKETDFFVAEKNWSRGLSWYHAQFTPGRKCYGEASPNYTKATTFPGVPERIAALIPRCRFIFLCRDPVERAASQYRHAVLSGQPIPQPEALAGTPDLEHLIETSAYAAQIEPYLAVFPRDAFLFLEFETLIKAPALVLSEVAEFLGIADEWPQIGHVAANSSDNLSRMPLWTFRLHHVPPLAWIKSRMPRGWRERVKRLLRRSKARPAPTLGPDLRAVIATRLHDDMARFRAITRADFGNWSI